MTIADALFLLFAGVGVFIVGMNMLSDGLERSAGGGLKRMLGKISGNRFAGVGIGAGVTAIIQSSSATSVMVIGFVNAGIMTLFQAVAIIMGANIGTTITGIIVALKSLPIADTAMLLAFVGVMMTFFKSDRVKQIGNILCGFGLIFVGLELMGNALAPENCPDLTNMFKTLFKSINFPLLLILCGVVFTALIQSSSAATGIFITMVASKSLTLDCAIFLVLGSNIGTCITAVLACIGTTANAKRTALIHLTFNVIGTILFTAVLWPLRTQAVALLNKLPVSMDMQLAWFHVIFNVTTTLVLLPFIQQLVRFSNFVIRDKEQADAQELRFVNELLLSTPPVAIMQTKKEIGYMASLARTNIENALFALDGKPVKGDEFMANEGVINFTNTTLTKYLIKLSPLANQADERSIGSYFHVLNDLERIGDHAKNFYEIATQMGEENLQFSQTAREEIKQMGNVVLEMFTIAQTAFEGNTTDNLNELTRLENVTDEWKRTLTANHFTRLADNQCSMESGAYFFSVVIGLERVADHLVNVGYSILNPTGSQSEARANGEVLQNA